MTPLERITKRVNRNGDVNDPATPRPLLTLLEFFEGNSADGSIGCNLSPMPTPAEFLGMLNKILRRPDVVDVLVEVDLFDDPEWPFAATIWLFTTASTEEITGWFPEEWAPDDVWEGWTEGQTFEPVDVPSGTRPVACWWD